MKRSRSALAQLPARLRQYRRFLRFLRPQWPVFAVGLTCTALIGVLTLINPILAKFTIDVAFPRRDLALFLQIVALSAGIVGIMLLLQFLEGAINIRLDQRLAFDLRRHFFDRLYRLRVGTVRARPVGDLLYRAGTDLDNVRRMILGTLPNLLLSTTKLVLLLIITLWIHWKLTLLSLASFPLLYANTIFFAERIQRLRTRGQQAGAATVAFTQEGLAGFPLLKAFGRERTTVRRFSRLAANLSRVNVAAGYTRLLAGGLGGVLTAIWSLGVGLYAGILVIRGEITIGEIVAVGMLLFHLQDPLNRFGEIYQTIVVGLVSAGRVEELWSEPGEAESITPSAVVVEAPGPIRGELELRGVDFGYLPGQRVLRDVNLHIAAGSHVALVGPPGAGKSTLMYLLARFYDPDRGEVLLDQRDLKVRDLRAYRSHLAMVLQQPVLFSGTIADNIALGLPVGARPTDLAEVVSRLSIDRLLAAFGLDMSRPVGEGGGSLSGGQRQAVALARALVREPSVLLLDEPTSFLDVDTEKAVTSLLDQVGQGRTSVTIAHRFATLKSADHIVVLDGGSIVQQGSHEELIAAGGFYQRMYQAQFTEWSEVQPSRGFTKRGPSR